MSKVSAKEARNAAAMKKEVQELEARIESLARKYDMMYDDRLNGTITEIKFVELAAKCEAEQRAAEERLKTLRQCLEERGSRDEAVREFIEIAEQYTTITELDRELLHTLISSIVIGDRVRTKDEVHQQITVNYKFMGRTAAVGAA